MVAELFLPHDMPEPPKEGFFKGLFGGGIRSLDREELCELSISLCCIMHHNRTAGARLGYLDCTMLCNCVINDMERGCKESLLAYFRYYPSSA
jgi:hypothetical protein